ncbi:SR-related CTD associated factor 6 isoform X2 [Rhipicephalus microplus]|uniref:SR-related CTD associated factor 6 isoform X2 n=1 Tax=Rhipicephalus microplus TaxID=6941 RepID=UPI003F6A64E8
MPINMEMPVAPPDQELRNIIDKLAQFVARNGPEFEQMTKQKQKDNPKFSFLFGGEYYAYYKHQVAAQQNLLKPKEEVPPTMSSAPPAPMPWQATSNVALAQLQQQVQEIQEQIRQSEVNLAAQHQVLLQQQQVQLDEAIRKAQDDKLMAQAKSCDIEIAELDKILQPIIESCTKDSISAGKGWIFSHSTTPQRNELISQYLLKKVTVPGAPFDMKLHIVYLINDVLHHCVRKNADGLKQSLDKVVVPIFCTTSIGVDEEKGQKLAKLLKLWETNNYFPASILEQLKNPAISLANYQASLITEHATVITSVTSAVQVKYSQLQKQHQDFVAHLTARLQALQFGVLPPAMAAQAGLTGVSALPTPSMLPQAAPAPATTTGQALPMSTGLPPPTSVSAPGPQVAIGTAATPVGSTGSEQQPQQAPASEQEATSQDSAVTGSEVGGGTGGDGDGGGAGGGGGSANEGDESQQPLEAQASKSIPESDPQLAQGHSPNVGQGPNLGPASMPDDGLGSGHPLPQEQHPYGPMSMNMDGIPPHMMPDQMPSRDMRPGGMNHGYGGPMHYPGDSYGGDSYGVDSYGGSGHMGGRGHMGGGHMGGGGPPYMGNGPPPPMSHFGPQGPPHYGMPPGYDHPPPPGYMHHGGPPHGQYGGMPPHGMHGFDPMDNDRPYYDDYDMSARSRQDYGNFYIDSESMPPRGDMGHPSAGPGRLDPRHPPPGFVPMNSQGYMPPELPPEALECLVPTMPYYELPAGLIVPLVRLDDSDYRPLDPKEMRLPPPAPPSEALMQAVEMFYSPPSHERPRNSEGWEQLGLYEFFKAKSQYVRKRPSSDDEGDGYSRGRSDRDEQQEERRAKAKEIEDQIRDDIARRKYRESKSPPSARHEEEPRRKKRSRSRSESRSPPRHSRRSRSLSRSHSRSRSRSRSQSPLRRRSPERSPTPPSFFGSSYGSDPRDSRLDESNKGHQLLRKMGWGGAGLGASEQGIQDPIHPGDVRDRQDLYKGVGINLHDPYENFRKSKGQAFINRMKARTEDVK